MALKGIDVSVWQGNIDWSRASKAIDFAILRGGYGKTIDAQFQNNVSGTSKYNVPIGVYWYSNANSVSDAYIEAQACIAAIKGKKLAYPVFYDVEEEDIYAKGSVFITQICEAFFNTLKQAGIKKLGIYSSASPLSTYFDKHLLSKYDVWVAHYGVSKPSYSGEYTMWQYTSTGSIPGIDGNVDTNYCYKDYTGNGTQSAVMSSSEFLSNDTAMLSSISPDMIDTESIKAYIATVDRKTQKLVGESLVASRVSGVMIEAGYLYDQSHMMTKAFANPLLDRQVKECQSAGLPYGLYMIGRAKNESEALSEMWWFSRYIQKHIPKYGAWIQLELSASKTINDRIVDTYREYLEKLGLRKKIGFYTTKDQLSKITWKDKCNDWYLWLNAHVSNLSELDGLLYPEFFMLDAANAKPRSVNTTYVNSLNPTPLAQQDVAGGTTITVPASVRQSGITGNYTNYTYMYGRWARSTIQYQLAEMWAKQGKPSSRNIATISGYYLAAVAPKFGTTGDVISVYLENGQQFSCILADAKGADAQSPYGHVFGDGTVDIIEWEKAGTPYSNVDNATKIDLTNWQGVKVSKISNRGRFKGLT